MRKTLDICFQKQHNSDLQEQQLYIMSRLQSVLPSLIAEKFSDVHVRIRESSSQQISVSGFSSTEKKKFMTYLEELWEDPSLLEE